MTTLVRLAETMRGSVLIYQPEDPWWWGQAFASEEVPFAWTGRPSAAWLAGRFLESPTDPRWQNFIWTSDVDDDGCPVYVGGVGIYGIHQFQVHRHLVIDDRWQEWSDE